MNDKLMTDEYYNFRSGGGVMSGSIESEVPPVYEYSVGAELHITCRCIICGEEIRMVNGSVDYICPDCKKAILWAKKKMKEEE